MSFFDNNNFGMVKILAYITGFWPYQNTIEHCFYSVLSTIVCCVIYLPEIFAAIKFNGDKEVIIELIPPFLTNIISIAKFIVNMYNRKLIRSLFDQMKNNLSDQMDENEYAILQHHARLGKFLAHGYAGAVFTGATIFTLEPLITRALNFLMNNNDTIPIRFSVPIYLYDIDMERHYYLIMFITGISILAVINVTVASDVIFIILLEHAAGLFAVTGYMMSHIPSGDDSNNGTIVESLTLEKMQYNHYIQCIKNHKRALKFAEDLESVYVWCFGIVVLLNIPLMSVTAIQITTQAHNVEQIFKYSGFIIGQLIHLFFDCFLSQQLMNYSSKIQEFIIAGKWYTTSPKVQKLITLITLRSQLPCKLTAGKIINLSLETYTTFVKTAGSYFTVINSMR